MNKLLAANFTRLKKDKAFLLFIAIMLLAGILLPIIHYMDKVNSEYEVTLERGFFAYAIFIIILTSVFTALFVGTEYSDGTIRNKVIVGHNRVAVYLSNLIVCLVAGILMCTAYLIPYLCIGIPLLGFFKVGAIPILLLGMCVFAMMAAFVALFTLIAMLSQNKAVTAVFCILLAFFLLFIGASIKNRLEAPEYYSGYAITGDGVTVAEKKTNPQYLTGSKRAAYEFLYDFLPGGQAVQLSGMSAVRLWLMPLYSVFILFVATGAGIIIFKKKDLK